MRIEPVTAAYTDDNIRKLQDWCFSIDVSIRDVIDLDLKTLREHNSLIVQSYGLSTIDTAWCRQDIVDIIVHEYTIGYK